MIIDMKKITLLCLETEKVRALEALRDLSIMHVTVSRTIDNEDVAALTKRMSEVTRAEFTLHELKKHAKTKPEHGAAKTVDRINALLDGIAAGEKAVDALNKEIDRLRVWGNFAPEQIAKLKESGICVTLCTSPLKMIPDAPEGATLTIVSKDSSQAYFIIVSQEPIDTKAFNVVSLPERPLKEFVAELEKGEKAIQKQKDELISLAGALPSIHEYKAEVHEQLEFAQNRESMGNSGEIAHITGYVPVDRVENIRAAALKEGWALLIQDPAFDDQEVPTCIRKPKWMAVMDPLFDFIGVTPGYRENDVNLFFLIFFPIFFGMLIGDAAYGVLFIGIAMTCKLTVCKGNEAARLPLNLILLLSSMSLIWGWLNGSWFGIPRDVLPVWMQGLDFLADPAESPLATKIAKALNVTPVSAFKDKFVQFLCFLLAAFQLSAARLCRTICDLKKTWRALGNLGWALLIWGNFFTAVNLIVFSGTFPTFAYYMYGVGFVLIVVTITVEASLNLPFALIGSFVDVLSYIRLFAVGMSGAFIAVNFNNMGKMLLDSMPSAYWALGLVFLIIVALFGHLLNIALGFLGVLVHAIRLNTLEFSNHMEMQWGGIRYKPFEKKQTNIIHKNKKQGESK